MKKRVLSLLLAFVMVLGMLPVSAFASQPDATEPTVQTEPVQAETTEPVTEETTEPVTEETTEPVTEETTEPAVEETTEPAAEEPTEPAAEEATEPAAEETITENAQNTEEAHVHVDEDGDKLCDSCGEKINQIPTLIAGVENRTVKIQTGLPYQVDDLVNGKIFEDADEDSLIYHYRKSSNGGQTWGDWTRFGETMEHGTVNKALSNSQAGTYTYEFKANDGYADSEARWILTLQVMDVIPSNVKFYLGRDHNYKTNGNIMPALELYRTAGIDENQFDYVGWFEKDGKTVYVYDPKDYEIIDGETDYVVINEVKYELHDYEKITFTNSAFDAADETATPRGTVVSGYNMFYVTVNTGRYSTRVYGYNTESQKYEVYLGGQSMELPREKDIYGNGGDDLYLRQVSVYTTSKKVDGTYFTADDYYAEAIMPITGSMIHSGDPYVSGNYTYFPFFSWAAGNGSLYNAYVYPYDTDNYIFSQTINQTTSKGTSVVNKAISIATAVQLTVTVPQTADFKLYFQYNNFNTKEMAPLSEAVANEDGTKTLTFRVSKSNQNYTWRMTDTTGKYVTRAGWLAGLTAATEKTYTFAQTDPTDKKTHDFRGLGSTVATRDEADLQVFLSASGFKGGVTETTRIRAYRMWQLINTDPGNIMVEPDFNIQVLKGNASDIKLVSGGNAVNNWIDVTPTTTDIVAVNYDALDVWHTGDTYAAMGGLFPATNPERTNVFIITNETAGTAAAHIPFNGSKTTDRGSEWDYNYDTWFYLNSDQKPTLDFTVTGKEGVAVSYATVITDASLKSTLSDWTSLTADAEGEYTVDLLPFRNAGTKGGTVIIKMTDSTGTSYALARVAEMTANVENVTTPGEPFTPGDEVSITFDGLYRSINKISGIFNPLTYYLRYTTGGTEINGSLGQYQQMDRTTLKLTIPEDITFPEGQTTVDYAFTNGYVYGSMYSASSPFSSMYYITDTGVGTNFSAVGTAFVLSRLPDISVAVQQKVYYDVKLNVNDGENPIANYTLTLTDADGNVLTPDENGVYQDLAYGDYGCTIAASGYRNMLGTLHIGSSDAVDVVDGILVKTVTLEKAAEGAWDGSTATEPKTDENGIYQIGTGAELAWFAQTVNAGTNSISAVLTADIDLANYNWTPIGNNSTRFTGNFDGQNHRVYNLYIRSTADCQGLFGYAGGADGAISNLTVEGYVYSTGQQIGGVAGAGSDFINVHSAVTVTGKQRVGGISGYFGTFTNCSNSGDVTATGNYVGGICGYYCFAVTGCFNSGNISGKQYVGGINGHCNGNIISCYNTGDVTASGSYVGGITPQISSKTLTNCFNTGAVSIKSNSGAIVGRLSSSNAVIHDNYYLQGSHSAGIGVNGKEQHVVTMVTADTLASADFVTAMNAGLETAAYKEGTKHPVLTWQPDLKNFSVILPTGEGYTVTGAATAKEGSAYTFTVELAVGYKAGESFAVKVNGEPVTADADGSYTVADVASDLTITLEGVEKIVWEPVSVYLSMSHDEAYLTGRESDTVMAFKNIEVPYFDLALYGMENFYFSSEAYGDDGDGEPGSALDAGTAAGAYGKITMLHLFIYATEIYYCGLEPADAGKGYLYNERLMGTDTFTYSGSVGSIYFNNLWGMDENLNYYLNYEYPLASEGWGSTADQILLEDGDIVTVGHFSDWLFHTDPASVFNYIKAGDDVITTKAVRGDRVKLSVILAGSDESGKYTTAHTPVTSEPEVYCIPADQLVDGNVTSWTFLGCADQNGEITLDTRKLTAGQYIIAIAGQYGVSESLTDSICSAPGGIILTIEDTEFAAGDVNMDGTVDILDANLVVAAICGSAELTQEQQALADVDGSERIDMQDVNMLISFAYGKITEFAQ